MALTLKSDVLPSRKLDNGSLSRMQPEILLAVIIAMGAFETAGVREMMVTSICDGTHMKGSLHYAGMAVDIRTKGTGMSQRLYDAVRKALPANLYDVLLENKDQDNEHIHIEYQPKG